ncbi:gamma-glutamyltransferase family protein [Aliiglaciecola litoralis]|uniref:Gamma-glutamyltransferase family protein n=1 Tax=Aliiglaciecola litoralis TaxID=582857 RepID=A0ABN1LC96_9ALTE
MKSNYNFEHSNRSMGFTAPHYAAAQAGQHILETGGTAIEAMVAAAASIAVVYPHMNGLGGDGFWLISEPGKKPIAIDASGCAAQAATPALYAQYDKIPTRGAKSALTMAGAVSGWKQALVISQQWQNNKGLDELFATAIGQAEWGLEVTQSLTDASFQTFNELSPMQGFEQFLIKGKALKKGKIVKLPQLANTLRELSNRGLDDFYCGSIAQQLSDDLTIAGSPIAIEDFHSYNAKQVSPLSVKTSNGVLYNIGAPTQGVASLLILALFDKLKVKVTSETDLVHLLVECTKLAFIQRDLHVSDASRLTLPLETLLEASNIESLSTKIDMQAALPWPQQAKQGDTVWMGACDNKGRMVSYIQSLYWEFGSGIVSPSTGVVWNNRGTSFSLDPRSNQFIQPGLKPFHTLNPAFAELNDGRRIAYGTMGGEGQPQTQAAIFSRYVDQHIPLVESIAAGRWLLGRTWGEQSHNLKVEADLDSRVICELKARGHDVQAVTPNNEIMGHAGAVVRHSNGRVDAASDPRSDGKAFPPV